MKLSVVSFCSEILSCSKRKNEMLVLARRRLLSSNLFPLSDIIKCILQGKYIDAKRDSDRQHTYCLANLEYHESAYERCNEVFGRRDE